jgi:hypothetical protein
MVDSRAMNDPEADDKGISRRGFLVTTGTVGGAAALQPSLSRAAGFPDPDHEEGKSVPGRAMRPEPGAMAGIARAVSLAVDNVVAEGLDDVFPPTFELEDLARHPDLRDRLERYVVRRIVRGDYGSLKPAHVVRVPKRNTRGFRKITVIDPTDYVTYLSLCILVAEVLESRRLPLAARRVYACRYAPRDGRLFRLECDFGGFRKAVRRRLGQSGGQVFATADIASFFPSIRRGCLARRLSELGVAEWLIGGIDRMLAHWESCGVPGLPVGSNASRILSEAMLARVDETLRERGVDFLRFMDDFRIFAPDTETANVWLEILSAALSQDGLALSAMKTTVQDVPPAIDGARLGRPGSPFHLTTNAYLVDRGRGSAGEPLLAKADENTGEGEDDLIILYKFNNTFRYIPYGKRGRRFARRVDLPELMAELDARKHLSRAGVRKFANACLYQQEYALLERLPRYLAKVPSATWYCTDFLIFEREALPALFKRSLADQLAIRLLEGRGASSHQALALLQLLASPDYARPEAVLRFYAGLPEDACPFLRRRTLDAVYRCQAHLPVSEVARTVSGVPVSDPWCVRALLRLARTNREIADLAGEAAARARDDPFAALYLPSSLSAWASQDNGSGEYEASTAFVQPAR